MSLYSSRPTRLAAQLASDVFTLLWIVGWSLSALTVRAALLLLAEPARATEAAARRIRDGVQDASLAANRVPLVGADLRRPLDSAASGVNDIAVAAQAQVQAIEHLALVVAIVVFVAPVVTWLLLWLPRRITFIRNAAAGARFVDASADLDLFALRAMATLPLSTLARVSDDPINAWRAGDRRVIEQLAGLALDREGLPRPTARLTDS